MNARHPIDRPVAPAPRPPRRPPSKNSKNSRNNDHPWLVAEVTTQLIANGVISVVAIVGLIKLIPYQLNQQAKFQEVKAEVAETERRVDHLRSDFVRHFDPKQTRNIMQEQSPKLDPNARRIFWLKQ